MNKLIFDNKKNIFLAKKEIFDEEGNVSNIYKKNWVPLKKYNLSRQDIETIMKKANETLLSKWDIISDMDVEDSRKDIMLNEESKKIISNFKSILDKNPKAFSIEEVEIKKSKQSKTVKQEPKLKKSVTNEDLINEMLDDFKNLDNDIKTDKTEDPLKKEDDTLGIEEISDKEKDKDKEPSKLKTKIIGSIDEAIIKVDDSEILDKNEDDDIDDDFIKPLSERSEMEDETSDGSSEMKVIKIDIVVDEETGENKKVEKHEIKKTFMPTRRNIDHKTLSSIKVEEIKSKITKSAKDIQEDENFLEMFKTMLNPIQSAFTSTVPLISSGMSVEIRPFTYNNLNKLMASLNKIYMAEGKYEEESDGGITDIESRKKINYNIIARENLILESIYDKIAYFSCGKLTLEEFKKKLMLSDFKQLMFGAYQATFPKSNPYSVLCNSCGTRNQVTLNNRDLLWKINKSITEKDQDMFSGRSKQLFTIEEATKQCKFTNYSLLNEYCIVTEPLKAVVWLKNPSIDKWFSTMEAIVRTDPQININTEFSDRGYGLDFVLLLPYIDSLHIPSIDKKKPGELNVSFPRTFSDNEIVKLVLELSPSDIVSILNSEEYLKIRLATTPASLYLPSTKCKNAACKKTIESSLLNPRSIFFYRIMKILD